MDTIKILPTQDKILPPLVVEVAASFVERFLGLMGRSELPPEKGLLIYPCSSIHMCFMRFAIDAVFVDKDLRVLKIYRSLPPWLGIGFSCGAWGVLEFAAGSAERYGWQVGDALLTEK